MNWSFTPNYIRQTEAQVALDTVTAERWNELWNLNITQGDHSETTLNTLINTSLPAFEAELKAYIDTCCKTTDATVADANALVKTVSFDAATGTFVFTHQSGSTTVIDTNFTRSADLSTLKYIRLGTGDVIEVSADGTNWTTIAAAGGHIVCASDGSEAAQRNKLKFVNLTVSDDGTYTEITAQAPNAATTGTLTVAGWASNSQTISVAGVTANNCVIVSPAPTSRAAYNDANVACTAQGDGTLTFGCEDVPIADITVNVLILAVA